MLPTFVIGLREGLEASLIVGIIAAFLVQRGDRQALRPMWIGVAAAALLCLVLAAALAVLNSALPFQAREVLEGILALTAVGGVTYMIVWMRRHSRELKKSIEAQAAAALVTGSVIGLAVMAFVAVLREGLETAIFMLAAFQNSRDALAAGIGAVVGVLVAVALGWGIYRGGIRINLSRFFRFTGVILVVVAAGLLAAAAHSLAEAGVLTLMQAPAVDLSAFIKPGSIQASLITGMLGLQPVPTVAEIALWFAYAIPMTLYVLWPQPRSVVPVEEAPSAVVPEPVS